MTGNVLVFIERREGEIKRTSLEAAAVAQRLAAKLGGRLEAVALGPGAAASAADLGAAGVARLHAAEHDLLSLYTAEAYAAVVAEAARRSSATLVIVAGTAMGRDVAARSAARLRAAAASDLIEIDVAADGVLRGKRPVYSGKAVATVALRGPGPAVVTLRPNMFAPGEAPPPVETEVVPLELPIAADAVRVRTVEVVHADRRELDVAEASVVVAGGRGLKEPANFDVVRRLAEALGAAVGASRAVVDAGWIEHAHQVGQTGKVVSPNLYIACGISGAVQHLAGMSSSKVIVAINRDADAPIFKVADYGIVGDLFEVVPALTEAVTKLRGG